MSVSMFSFAAILAPVALIHAAELHVAITGSDASPGTQAAPLRTIQRAAEKAMPGDTVTVHAGLYREHVNPPRGGISDSKRIIYQAAPGEEVIITGSEPAKGWVKESGDTWKLTLPNSYFGKFNPFAKAVHGDWFDPRGRVHHLGMVYLNGEWMAEAASHLNEVRQPAAGQPRWYARVDGAEDADYLLNIAAFTIGTQRVEAASFAGKSGELHEAGSSMGGKCIGWIRSGSWLRFDKVDFGIGTDRMEFWAATETDGGDIEVRLNSADGELLGKCEVADTGAWSKWVKFKAGIKPVSGEKSICLVFRSRVSTGDTTTIWAQFPGMNPNTSDVEIAKRYTVFTPETTNIDFITVRGFKLRNAASNWAAPTSGQHGLVTAYWCKGWIIEDNEISYSRCCGIALGKYSDEWDNRRGNKVGYDGTIADALKTGGWYKDKIGWHIVRRNHIHHCGQTGIVGSLGCAFSRVENNEIHDINKQGIWGGAEMAGIKFHGAIDTVISGNHIYRCGSAGGLWLDWMAQGTQVTGNLIHDNEERDIFNEVNHGPLVIANNILLSPVAYLSCSQGGAYAHNLITGGLNDMSYEGRQTPYHKAHSTELAGRRDCPVGDVRWYNNLLAGKCNLNVYDKAVLPVAAAGNLFTKGAQSSKFDEAALLKPDFDPGITLTQQADGWYLELNVDKAWAAEQKRRVVGTEMLGKAVIPDLPFENADGSPLKIDTDYFGKKRDTTNPFPGPFEAKESGKQKMKVWPLASTRETK